MHHFGDRLVGEDEVEVVVADVAALTRRVADEQQGGVVLVEFRFELAGELLAEGGVADDVAGPSVGPLEEHVHGSGFGGSRKRFNLYVGAEQLLHGTTIANSANWAPHTTWTAFQDVTVV